MRNLVTKCSEIPFDSEKEMWRVGVGGGVTSKKVRSRGGILGESLGTLRSSAAGLCGFSSCALCGSPDKSLQERNEWNVDSPLQLGL